jgi:thioredoxin 1
MKAALRLILPLGLLLMMILLFIYKDKLTETASQAVRSHVNRAVNANMMAFIDSAYNYTQNGEPYQYTFLEFGASGCRVCRQMETVMQDIRESYPGKVKVVFINISLPENHSRMLYYGVVAIPTQVLLDIEGKEYFRHTGYYATDEMKSQFPD